MCEVIEVSVDVLVLAGGLVLVGELVLVGGLVLGVGTTLEFGKTLEVGWLFSAIKGKTSHKWLACVCY